MGWENRPSVAKGHENVILRPGSPKVRDAEWVYLVVSHLIELGSVKAKTPLLIDLSLEGPIYSS